MFKASDWERAIEEKALKTAQSRAASKKRKTSFAKAATPKGAATTAAKSSK